MLALCEPTLLIGDATEVAEDDDATLERLDGRLRFALYLAPLPTKFFPEPPPLVRSEALPAKRMVMRAILEGRVDGSGNELATEDACRETSSGAGM